MKLKRSIFSKYLGICVTVLLGTVVCIGAALLLTASHSYRAEEQNFLIEKAGEVATATKLSYMTSDGWDVEHISSLYHNYLKATGMNFTLTDSNGKMICCTESDGCYHIGNIISEQILSEFDNKGAIEVGTLDGIYGKNNFIYGISLTVGDGHCYLFVASSAEEYQTFLLGMYTTFAIIIAIGIIIATLIIFFVTRHMIAPIEKVTIAAERFGKGDFSEKINISEENELGLLAKSLNEMAYSLSTTDQTRKSFVANVSHELRTPMTTIGGFVDGIRDGTIPEEQHPYYLGLISEEVSRLTRLVKSMLNISKFESGEMKIKCERFDVTELAIKTALLFEKKIEEKNVEVRGLGGAPMKINADADLIGQVIWNLTENAVKFVENGGYLEYNFSIKNGYYHISIKNSGEGLEHDEIPRVFDRFYKTDESRGKDKNGVGLGLSIVRSIVKLHNGEIMIKSFKGEYVEFIFTIPVSYKRRENQEKD